MVRHRANAAKRAQKQTARQTRWMVCERRCSVAEPEPTDEPVKKSVKKSTKDEEIKASKAADLKARKAQLQREMEKLINDSEDMLKEAEQE